MGQHAVFFLVPDGPQGQVAFVDAKRGFRLGQLDVRPPKLRSVTIDAIGCQTAIAEAILDAEADYVLAVKSNHRTLYDGLAWFFCCHGAFDYDEAPVSRHETQEDGHGRRETRPYFVCDVPDDSSGRESCR